MRFLNNIIHTGQSIHYSGKKFTNIKLLDGNSSEIPTRKSADGYASIKFLSTSLDEAIQKDNESN